MSESIQLLAVGEVKAIILEDLVSTVEDSVESVDSGVSQDSHSQDSHSSEDADEPPKKSAKEPEQNSSECDSFNSLFECTCDASSTESCDSDCKLKQKLKSVVTKPHIQYSERYSAGDTEYRHVILPYDVAKKCPKGRLLTEEEWRNLGVQQSQGWVHYAIHNPEPHILLFKRPIQPLTK